MEITTGYQHITLNGAGKPIIAGTTMKVVELVLDHQAEMEEEIALGLGRVDVLQKTLKPSTLRERLKAKGLL